MTTKKRMVNLDGEYHKYYKVFGLYGRIEIDHDLGIAKYTSKNDWDSFSGIWEFEYIEDEWCFKNSYEFENYIPKSYMEVSLEIIHMIEELTKEDI